MDQLAAIADAIGVRPGTIVADADEAVRGLGDRGVRVVAQRAPHAEEGAALLGAAAVGALIALILTSK
jgi:hypothetical protein